jgi:DNA-binding transcriptional MerR regulator
MSANPEAAASGAITIAEAGTQTGLSARTLRYYEEVGLLPGVRRRAGGRRVYGADQLERLRFITRLKALGLSLAEIKELNAVYAIGGSTRAMLRRLAELLDRHLADVDARIDELAALRGEIRRYREHIARRVDGGGEGA